jgi:uncharacterized protein YegJ (DUF2314 family)
MKILVLSMVLVMIVGFGFWMYRRKNGDRESAMISLVVLLREPITFDAAVLAKTAGKMWDADLGDGSNEGVDGFAVNVGHIGTIRHLDRTYLVNSIPAPYFKDPETTADEIHDLRVRRLYREHRAWFSCDALIDSESMPPEEITQWYGRLAALVSNFVNENCLLVYVPQTHELFPITDETRRALESDDPLAALREAAPVPITGVSPDDDEELAAAEEEARTAWPRFVGAFEQRSGEGFSVKAPITHEDTTEFIWITVSALEGDRIYGTLGNEPADLGPLALGSKVSVSLSELSDWCYIDSEGHLQGGFTISVVMKAANR